MAIGVHAWGFERLRIGNRIIGTTYCAQAIHVRFGDGYIWICAHMATLKAPPGPGVRQVHSTGKERYFWGIQRCRSLFLLTLWSISIHDFHIHIIKMIGMISPEWVGGSESESKSDSPVRPPHLSNERNAGPRIERQTVCDEDGDISSYLPACF
jgi:hypothetical protein